MLDPSFNGVPTTIERYGKKLCDTMADARSFVCYVSERMLRQKGGKRERTREPGELVKGDVRLAWHRRIQELLSGFWRKETTFIEYIWYCRETLNSLYINTAKDGLSFGAISMKSESLWWTSPVESIWFVSMLKYYPVPEEFVKIKSSTLPYFGF